MPVPCLAVPRSIPRSALTGAILAVALGVGAPPGAHAQVSAANSFFVPQSGPFATPTEGTLATRFFRACPNNDGGSSLPNNARIKVVLRDGGGSPLAGVAAADICIRFNGGTPIQGFAGVGADSIIANSTFNPDPLCPDVTCIEADGPTDATGTTFITFTGAGGVRDSDRKWGHYDSEIPVYALGTQIFGRLTTASMTGSYILRIKNMDVVDGLELDLNAGAAVTIGDLSSWLYSIGVSSPVSYWLDLDSTGGVTAADYNFVVSHFNHDCDTPLSP